MLKASAQAIDPSAFLRLEIKATKEGSFETIIDAVARYTPDLINKDNVRLACEIVAGFLSFLQIKSHLKEKKFKSIEQTSQSTIVTNQDNQSITGPTNIVNCYLNDSKIDNTIVQIFTDLKTSNRTGIVIEHIDKSESFQKADYEKMTATIVEKDKSNISKQTSDIINDCELIIKKPDLIGRSKWNVLFAGRSIDIKIDDDKFLQQIREGIIKISGGYKLVGDLKIQTEIDDDYNIINAEYILLIVRGIKDKEEQLNLFN